MSSYLISMYNASRINQLNGIMGLDPKLISSPSDRKSNSFLESLTIRIVSRLSGRAQSLERCWCVPGRTLEES